MPSELGLKDSARKLVFRKLVSILQNDPKLKAVINKDSWHVFAGLPDDSSDFAEGEAPAIRILPTSGQASPETNARQNAPFNIKVDILTDGLDVGDLLDLWGAVEDAIFTGDGAKAALRALMELPIRPNSVSSIALSDPAITPNPVAIGQNCMLATGTLTVFMLIKK